MAPVREGAGRLVDGVNLQRKLWLMSRELSEAEVEAFRAEVCKVAVELFVDRGYEAVTIREIARRVGCSAMTPYRYYANKAEIFDAVRSECFARFGEWVQREVAAFAPDLGPIERIRALGRCYIGFALVEPRAYRMMFEVERLEPTDGVYERDLKPWYPLLDATRDAVAAGAIKGDVETLAHLFWACLHGIVALHHAGRLRLGRTLDDLVEPSLDLMLRGLP